VDAQLVALAAAAAQALVTSMTTAAWASIRERFAHLFGRGDPDATARAGASLDEARAAAEAGDAGAVTGRWQGRLELLLEQHPELAAELTALVAEAAGGDGAGSMNVHVTAGRDSYVAGRDIGIHRSAG
jgi:hypothetical protein